MGRLPCSALRATALSPETGAPVHSLCLTRPRPVQSGRRRDGVGKGRRRARIFRHRHRYRCRQDRWSRRWLLDPSRRLLLEAGAGRRRARDRLRRPCAGSPRFLPTASCPKPMSCRRRWRRTRRRGAPASPSTWRSLMPPPCDRPAGGRRAPAACMVPLTDDAYVIDLAEELRSADHPRRPLDARHHQPHAAVDRSHPPARPAACRRGDQRTRDAA